MFLENQFQYQEQFYARWLAAIFLFLYRHGTDQHSIKGVLMQRWKPAQFEGVGLGDRKFSYAMP